MAIIQNGSPLFAGDAGSGPSNIRQYILENDWLDAIVQLSTDQFMNTGISTYIWVLCKDKRLPTAAARCSSLTRPTAMNSAAKPSAPSATTSATIAGN